MKTILAGIVASCLLSTVTFSQTTIVLQPGPADGKDAYINSAFPADTGGQRSSQMACSWTFGGTPGDGRTLFRFDFSLIPPGSQVLDARLTLFFDPMTTFGAHAGENASVLERITQNWDEMTVTWLSQPGTTTAGMVSIPRTTSPAQDIENVDITAFVSDWVLDPESNFGFMHRMSVEVPYCCVVYSSSDNALATNRPILVITYLECEVPVAAFGYKVQAPHVAFYDSSSHAQSWNWDFGDGYFSNLQNPVHSYSQQGIYKVCLAVEDSCGRDTICDSVHVCVSSSPHFNYSVNGKMVQFADSSNDPLSWYWDFGDGFYSDLQNPEHYFNAYGTYYVCEKVTGACDTRTYCDSVAVLANGIGEGLGPVRVTIAPNPATDYVSVVMDVLRIPEADIELFTLYSCPVRTWMRQASAPGAPVVLDLTGIPKGLYFLRIKFDGHMQVNKLVIR